MTVPEGSCHQPEVNKFLNIVSPLSAGPGSRCVFADLFAPHEKARVKIVSSQLIYITHISSLTQELVWVSTFPLVVSLIPPRPSHGSLAAIKHKLLISGCHAKIQKRIVILMRSFFSLVNTYNWMENVFKIAYNQLVLYCYARQIMKTKHSLVFLGSLFIFYFVKCQLINVSFYFDK